VTHRHPPAAAPAPLAATVRNRQNVIEHRRAQLARARTPRAAATPARTRLAASVRNRQNIAEKRRR
jgi:hypothetical protein